MGPDQNVKWRTELPEAGNSTPIVSGDRIFVTQSLSESNERALICFDRNDRASSGGGRSVRYGDAEATQQDLIPIVLATPVSDGDRVIAWFGSAGLICWDNEGSELWRRDLGRQEHMWGYGSSPILHKDLWHFEFWSGQSGVCDCGRQSDW